MNVRRFNRANETLLHRLDNDRLEFRPCPEDWDGPNRFSILPSPFLFYRREQSDHRRFATRPVASCLIYFRLRYGHSFAINKVDSGK